MKHPSTCDYCGEPHLNFSGEDEEVELWIEKVYDGKHVIATDSPCAPLVATHGAPRSITARSADEIS